MTNVPIEVANALHYNLAIPPYRVAADVERGLVTLRGVVDWDYQRSYAEATVRCVQGVRDVRNEIAVNVGRQPINGEFQ